MGHGAARYPRVGGDRSRGPVAVEAGSTLAPRRIAPSSPRIVRPLYLRLTLDRRPGRVSAWPSVGIALVPAALGLAKADTATPTAIDLGPLDQRSYVYASDGTVLATLRAEIDRQPVPLKDIPERRRSTPSWPWRTRSSSSTTA